ncbi:site-specific recombinase [Ampullimonas aquatilis]|uniref:site-specific recombinase n=1 Tax=Ampullimonas aquatilis TaxID=1341549 RepID=UPI003C7239D4
MSKRLYSKWRESKTASQQLDTLLTQNDVLASLPDRNQWLIELFYWLRRDNQTFDDYRNDRLRFPEHTRLAFLIQVLNRHPHYRRNFVAALYSVLRDNDPISLYCDTGMASRPSFWDEFLDRVQSRFLPPSPNHAQLSSLFSLLFIDEHDADWIEALPDDLLAQFADLFRDVNAEETLLNQDSRAQIMRRSHLDIGNSIAILVSKVCAAGLNQSIRSRLPSGRHDQMESFPFFRLNQVIYLLLNRQTESSTEFVQQINEFRGLLDDCRKVSKDIYKHLEENGVSVAIVFELDRMLLRIERVDELLAVWLLEPEQQHRLHEFAHLTAQLIRANQAHRSLRHLIDSSLSQLARKVVESSAETGEHYIARDGKEYSGMLRMAAGGGAMTAITVMLKLFIASLGMGKFLEGFVASLNYSFSFLAIHFAHFTLATKQPAMTAPALASRLDQANNDEGRETFVDETFALIRTQVAAILGNLSLVIPVALGFELLFEWLTDHTMVTPFKAMKVVDSFNLIGPTPFYAAFTGVLLWISSLAAGWVDNWFVLYRVHDVITYHRRLRYVFGEWGAQKLADFFQRNISGVAASVSLGFLLGLLPEILAFIGLDIQPRHVTLSTGQLAVAVGTMGWPLLHDPTFWLAVAGIAVTGFLNLLVSFGLAFNMALGSRHLKGVDRSQIYQAVRKRMLRRPFSLFFPERK